LTEANTPYAPYPRRKKVATQARRGSAAKACSRIVTQSATESRPVIRKGFFILQVYRQTKEAMSQRKDEMKPPCVVIATFVPLPGQHETVKSLLLEVAEEVYEEKGCITYALHEATNGSLVFIEKWQSRELWQEHSKHKSVERIKDGVKGLLSEEILVHEMYGVHNRVSSAASI
tara:strand:- start:1314 stop:1835 length:522 start_codon:yes stop_codon:yes gene_type:complete